MQTRPGRVTFDFHTGDVEVCCFQEDFACLAAPADAPRVFAACWAIPYIRRRAVA